MKWFTKLSQRIKGLTNAIARYPLTTAFLLAATVIVAASINAEKDYTKLLLTCAVGATLSASLQAAYERFFSKVSTRIILMGGGGILLTLGYYLILRAAPEFSMETHIRTWIVLLALFLAFIWVPIIRSRISFNESFMTAFKAFFHSAFYAIVIFAGCSLIIMAIDTLITDVNHKVYSHTANIIFVLFTPLFFLSLIPVYPGRKDKDSDNDKNSAQNELINKAAFCPKFLEILISYIIIPLTAVFTVILLLYIVLNIRGEFWTNNLLEPMLVSYAIAVILIYILASRLENKFAILFRRIFPKVLVPIVLFQITASTLSMGDTGITHTRYFVILFGIFAAFAGVVMSLLPVRRNGIIAAMLIAFCVVSVIPPIDAFTVSRISQEKMLKSVLIQNKMLKNNVIIPDNSISDQDKKKIISFVEYLSMMDYTDKIEWFPDDFIIYEDFYNTFGFYEYGIPDTINRTVNVFLNSMTSIDIAGYDVLARTNIHSEENMESQICNIQKSGREYTLVKEKSKGEYDVILMDDNKQELIRFNTDKIFSKYSSYATDKAEISKDEATFSTENERVKLTIVVQEAGINFASNQNFNYADFYILVRFK
nr:DUF4153 domain-containing protein [uncultured Aminipila sp.]